MVRVADDLHGPLMICSGIVGSLDNNPTVLEFKFEISSRIIRGGVTDSDFLHRNARYRFPLCRQKTHAPTAWAKPFAFVGLVCRNGTGAIHGLSAPNVGREIP